MIDEFHDFSKNLKNNNISFTNEQLNNSIIKKYSFVRFQNDNNDFQINEINKNINFSNIMMISYYEKSDDKYFILGIEKQIILIHETSLYLLSPIFESNLNLSICFLPNSKTHFEQIIKFPYNEIKYDIFFQEEIRVFNQNMIISKPKTDSYLKIWNIIKSCISGYLIKRGYQKSIKNRLKDTKYNQMKNDSSIKYLNNEFFVLRTINGTCTSTINLLYNINKQKLMVNKLFNTSNIESDNLNEREIQNYRNIYHRFLPKFYGISNNNCLIIEYINGTLLNNINELDFTDNDRITIIFELMIVIHYLQSKKYVYRDLKPLNVIIDSNKTAILIDFDRLIFLDDDSINEIHTANLSNVYCAPEVLNGKISYKSDIYSLGQMLYFIMMNGIQNNEQLMESKYPEMNKIFQRCIRINENERPTISQLILVFYINFYKFIQIDNFYEIFYEQLSQCFDEETINKEDNSEIPFQIGCFYNDGKIFPLDVKKAFYYFKLAADKNHSQAQFNVGLFYYEGKTVEKSISETIKYYELSAKQNNLEALVCLGHLYRKGEVVTKDYVKAREYFELASELNSAEAQDCLGNMYNNGEGVQKDYHKAVEYYELAAKQNNADAIFTIGYYYYIGRVFNINYAKAKEKYEEAAKQNYAPAFNGLGLIYIRGLGVKLDMEIGIQYLEKAAKLNSQNALINLGNIYSYGRGVKQDFKIGRSYYEKAAEQGNSSAYNNIGNLYFEGVGVDQDYLKAKEYYEKAAKIGNADALNVLGHMYDYGKGVKKDYATAIKYYEMAIRFNQPNAHNNLGNIYLHANGVKRDCLKAKDLFKKSSKLGNARGSYLLANLYFNGYDEIPQNFTKAVKYYEKAAKANYVLAICMLGDIYYYGLGFDINYSKAIEYYSLASEYRNNKASFQIGVIYFYGKGTERNYEKAKEYFMKSSKENDLNSFYYLGQIYEKGKGVEIDIEKAVEYYKKCAEKKEDTILIDYNQGWAHYNIKNDKFYQSINNIGLIYLFKYKNIDLAKKYLKEVGHNNFALGKNNFGFLNLFYLNYREKAFNMFENASKMHFSISEFQFGYMKEEPNNMTESITHYHNVLAHEKQNLGIDDEQLYSSNMYIYCLTNLKLFLYYLSNPRPNIDHTLFLVNSVFMPLYSLLLHPNKLSYSYKFTFRIKIAGNNIEFLNLKDFFIDFPWDGNIIFKNDSTDKWQITKLNSKSKNVIISFDQNTNKFEFKNANEDSDEELLESKIKYIINNLNDDKNKFLKSKEIIDIKDMPKGFDNENDYNKKDDFPFDENDDNCQFEKFAISSVHDDFESYLFYPKYFQEILIQSSNRLKEIIEDTVKEITDLLYTPPYYILFGRYGEREQTIEAKKIIDLGDSFLEGFGLDFE